MAGKLSYTRGRHGIHVYQLDCSGCPQSFVHRPANAFTDSDREDETMKMAHRAGWDTWKGPRKSFCPECSATRAAAEAAKRQRRTAPTPARIHREPQMTKAVIPPAPAPVAANLGSLGAALVDAAAKPPAQVAEQPRTMGFDEKRIIIAKLQDVYVDHKTGYDRGWSDKRVAEDLGVPRAWVAEVRETNFGPARDNDEVREVLAEARTVLAAAKDLTEQALKVEEQYVVFDRARSEVMAQISRLERRLADVEKAVA